MLCSTCWVTSRITGSYRHRVSVIQGKEGLPFTLLVIVVRLIECQCYLRLCVEGGCHVYLKDRGGDRRRERGG
jgi:hypothetical protein